MVSDTSTVVAATAAAIPDVVKDAFVGAALTLGDILLLEQAGCRFLAAGVPPTMREMTALYWLLSDKAGFAAAVACGDFDGALMRYADTLSPSVIPASSSGLKDALARAFAPAGSAAGDGGNGGK